MAVAHLEIPNSNVMLEDDELMAFMREMDESWVLEPMTLSTPAVVSVVSSMGNAIRPKKPRRSRRVDIIKARKELAELELELQIMCEKHVLYESLEAARSSGRLELRISAWRERILRKSASQENAQLRKRLSANAQLIKRISRLMHRQESQAKAFPIDDRILGLDYTTHVYRVLQSCVDIRNKCQLDGIVHQCNQVFVGSELEMIRWSTFALEDHGVGVGFHEAFVLPFSASFITDAIIRNSFANAHNVVNDNYVDKIAVQPIPERLIPPKVTASDQHVTLRRLEHERNSTVVLWEDATCWQSEDGSRHAFVRCSGWALITPAAAHGQELGAVHCGGFIQIHAMDGSTVLPTDTLVEDIVAYKQSLQRSRMAALDRFLL